MYTLPYSGMDTISSVKHKVFSQSGIPVEQQRLIFAGKELSEENKTCSDYLMESDVTLHLVIRKKNMEN